MLSRNATRFVACAVANGLASITSLASAIAGHWIVCASALAVSIVLAAGMIMTMESLRPLR